MAIHLMCLNSPASGTTLTSNITAGSATLTYTGSDVFAVGDLILIDNEVIGLGAINTSTNVANLIRARLNTTAASHTAGASIRTVVNLAVHEMVTDAEATQAGQDIIDAWSPGGNVNQAAAATVKSMVNTWRKETIIRLTNRDSADELTSLNTANATAQATYNSRFVPVP